MKIEQPLKIDRDEKKVTNRNQSLAVGNAIDLGLFGITVTMLGTFSENLILPFKIPIITVGIIFLILPIFVYKEMIRKRPKGKFLRFILMVETIIERDVITRCWLYHSHRSH